MRGALLAAVAALGLTGAVVSAGATTVLNPAATHKGWAPATADIAACPAGWYWAQLHYDRHQVLWPTGCVPNGD